MKKRKSKEEKDNEYLDMANIEQRKIEDFKKKDKQCYRYKRRCSIK